LIVRRDLKKGLIGESIIDTGFDAAIYANLKLAEFLEGITPTPTSELQAAGHSIGCEVFTVECHVVNMHSKTVLTLGRVEVYCPVDPIDLSEDVIVGRAILNRLTLHLDGKLTKVLA